jgi:hypothetical protein
MPSQDINDYLNQFNISNIQTPDTFTGQSNLFDTENPYSFKEWLKIHTSIGSGREFKEYDRYLRSWYSSKEGIKTERSLALKSDYVNFVNELSVIFKDDPQFKYISDIDFDDNVDIEYAIPYYTKKIKEICFYIINKRDSAKKAKIKYNMAGSTQALEKLFYQYLLQAFTKKNTLIQVPEFSGVETLPALSSISDTFKIVVEEVNDAGNYFDKDPSVDYYSELPLSSYFENLDYTDSYQWIFESGSIPLCSDNPLFFVLSSTLEQFGVESAFALPFSAIDLADRFAPTPNVVNFNLLSQKYSGNDFYVLTGGFFILKELEHTFNLSQGNNWFYWPSGEAFFENDQNVSFDLLPINKTSLLEQGAISNSDYRKADKIFIQKDNDIQGSWLRFYKATLETETMSCAIGFNKTFEFKFPYPNYGIVGDGTSWTGRGISNIDNNYETLDDDTKNIVDDIYWETTSTTEQVCAIDINQSSLIESGAFPSIYYKGADKLSKRKATGVNKVNDSEPDSVYKDGFEYAWLYKFLKTDLPVRSGRNEIQFPIQRVDDNNENYLKIGENFCNPVQLSSIDINTFLGSRAGYYLADSDIIYKLSSKNGYPIECAYLRGSSISQSLPQDIQVTGNENQTFIATVTGNMQVGLTVKAKPDTPETFLWQDEDTSINNVNISYKKHQDDCPFALHTEHTSIYEQKDLKPFDFTYPWKDCECKAVLYSPIGHPGNTFDDYSSMADIIVLDTQDPNAFSVKEWRDLNGDDYKTSSDFAWYQISKNNNSNEEGFDVDVGMGKGSWVTGSGSTFVFKKGKQYKYIRNGLGRTQTEITTDTIPPIIISHNYNHPYKPSWKRAILKDQNWVETLDDSDMILNAGDYIMYDHFESNFYCLEYEGTYKEYFNTTYEQRGSNPNNDIWVNFTNATTGLVVQYKWPNRIYGGLDVSVPQTNVLASDLSSVTWSAEIIDSDNNVDRYSTILSPESDFTVIGYTPQTVNVTATGGGVNTGLTFITLNPVQITEPILTQTLVASGERQKQTIYSDSINFIINTPLYGWDYDNFRYDGVSEGARPFWGQAIDDDSYTTKFKGVREWGYGLRVADEYTFIHQPNVSFIKFETDDTIKYEKNAFSFIWRQPVDFVRDNDVIEWCDLVIDPEKTSPLSSYFDNQNKELVVYPTSSKSTLSLEVGDFVNYWATNSFVWTQNLTDSTAGIPPFGGLYVPFASSLLIESDVPYANLVNRHFPTIAVYPIASNFYTDRDSGTYFNHKGLGTLTYINKDFTNIVNPELSANELTKEQLIFRDPNIFVSNDLGLTEKRAIGPIINSENDSRWMKGNLVEGYKSGQINVEDDYKEFVPYQVKEEITKRNNSGLLDIEFDLDPWTGHFDKDWKDTINWPPNFRKQNPVKQWNFDLDYFVKRQYFTTYDKKITISDPYICLGNETCSKTIISKNYECTTCLGPKGQPDLECFFTGGVYTLDTYNVTSDGGLLLQVNGDFYKLNYIPLYKYDELNDTIPSPDSFAVLYGEQREDVKHIYFGMVSICVNNVEFYTPVYRSKRTSCEVSNISGVYDFSPESEFYSFGYLPVFVNEVDRRLVRLYTKGKVPTKECTKCAEPPDTEGCFEYIEFPPISAYFVDPLSQFIIEGESVDFEVLTYNVPDGTVIYWNVIFENPDAFDFAEPTSGQFTLQNSEGYFNVTTVDDNVIEGDEKFRVEIRLGGPSGEVKATSNKVIIGDLTHQIYPSKSTIIEGESVEFLVNTTNVPDGTVLYWTLNSLVGSVDANDFDPAVSQGAVTINKSKANFTLTTIDDLDDGEGDEQFEIELRVDSYAGQIRDTSGPVTILQPTYGIQASPSSIIEGESITFDIATEHIPNGTVLYWTIISDGDPSEYFSSTSGSVTILGNSVIFSLDSISSEDLTPSQNMTIQLRTGGISGDIRDTDSFTVNQLPATYSIEATPNDVLEGDSMTVTINTTNIADGTVLDWDFNPIVGNINDADFSPPVNHSVIINGNTANFILDSIEEPSGTEGDETFTIQLSDGGVFVAETPDILILRDLSYDLSVTPTSLVEGGGVFEYTITTYGLPAGTNLYVDFESDDPSNTPITKPPFDVNIMEISQSPNNPSTITFEVTSVASDEGVPNGVETLTATLYTGGFGETVRDTEVVQVFDLPATYSISADKTIVFEGESVNFAVSTTNVLDGTELYWSFHGDVNADDFISNIYNNPFTVNSNQYEFEVFTKNDFSTNEGDESFFAGISSDAGVSPALATTETILLSDVGFLNKNTDIYALFDTTSMRAEDGFSAARALTAWHETLPNKISGYEGKLKIAPLYEPWSGTEGGLPLWVESWLLYPSYINERVTRMYSGANNSDNWSLFSGTILSDTPHGFEYTVNVAVGGVGFRPDAVGTYLVDGIYNNVTKYIKDDGLWTIWWNNGIDIDVGRYFMTLTTDVGDLGADRYNTAEDGRSASVIELATWNNNGYSGSPDVSINFTDNYYSDPKPNNFVCIAFVDETHTDDIGNISYHGSVEPNNIGNDFNKGPNQPTIWFNRNSSGDVSNVGNEWPPLLSFRDTLFNITNSEGGFFKGVLYPISRAGGLRKAFMLHAHGAIYGRTLTNDELFGVGGTYINPATDGIYRLSSTGDTDMVEAWTDLRQMTNLNPYVDGLINYGWALEGNKFSPASAVFTSETFGNELDDLLTN